MNIIKRYSKYFTDPYYSFGHLLRIHYPNRMSDKYYLKCFWYEKMGYKINISSPRTLNEKLQWLKLNDRNPIYPILVDKYEAKKWISDNLSPDLVIPTYGIFDSFDEIEWSSMPEQFVMKCTHDSGSTIICKELEQFDVDAARKLIESHQKMNFYWWAREWPYKHLKPRIICEKLLICNDGRIPNDYKLHYIDGELQFVYVSYDRGGVNDRCVYDRNWNRLPFVWVDESNYRDGMNTSEVPRPVTLEKMIKYGDMVSKNMSYVRVDFYEVDGHLYMGEITLYHGGGFDDFFPKSYDLYFGQRMSIPK